MISPSTNTPSQHEKKAQPSIMAPNRLGGPLTSPTPRRRRSKRLEQQEGDGRKDDNPQSVISKVEIASRGSGTDEASDTYEPTLRGEKRVFFTAVGQSIEYG